MSTPLDLPTESYVQWRVPCHHVKPVRAKHSEAKVLTDTLKTTTIKCIVKHDSSNILIEQLL